MEDPFFAVKEWVKVYNLLDGNVSASNFSFIRRQKRLLISLPHFYLFKNFIFFVSHLSFAILNWFFLCCLLRALLFFKFFLFVRVLLIRLFCYFIILLLNMVDDYLTVFIYCENFSNDNISYCKSFLFVF